ncbi:MAG: hypothetical protein KY467_13865 [Gemmatimonadetes bacterium]|nr:hypothetical protein [Gemmatimonadota bacterium]
MEFLVLLFVGWILWSIVGAAARNAEAKRLPPPAFYDPAEVPQEPVLYVQRAPVAVLPARGGGDEISSGATWDEVAADAEPDYSGAEVVSLEPVHLMSVEARPMPGEAVSLEQEVDRQAEHDAFHRRYVDDHSAGAAARHGLLDQMRHPGALRRAVLMAEILGPPRSLRK